MQKGCLDYLIHNVLWKWDFTQSFDAIPIPRTTTSLIGRSCLRIIVLP